MGVSIVGFGVVGRWVAAAIERRRGWLESECALRISVVSVATRRGGFIYREDGLDVPVLLAATRSGRPLAKQLGARHWPTATEGLAATGADVLVESSNTNPRDPEPALSHVKLALEQGSHAVTSSKGACAAAAVELMSLARERGVEFRMESTVMSGTPVLSTIRDGLAGVRVTNLRGILNATANFVLTRMGDGLDYDAAVAEAQRKGYAEPDPIDDVEGHDVVAKARVLAAVAFGCQLPLGDVRARGISDVSAAEVQPAVSDGRRIRLVATIRPVEGAPGDVEARVEPVALPLSDPLARVDGVNNALTIETDLPSEVTVIGPGAGREQAGQGVFADLVAVLTR